MNTLTDGGRSLQLTCAALLLAACQAPAPAPPADPAPAAGDTIVQLKNASAAEVAAVLNGLMEDSQRACQRRGCVLYPPGHWPAPGPDEYRFAADTRTNSLLFRATPEDLPRVLELVARLDAQMP